MTASLLYDARQQKSAITRSAVEDLLVSFKTFQNLSWKELLSTSHTKNPPDPFLFPMATTAATQSHSFDSPVWDMESERPIVDGKYNDPVTGEIRKATGCSYYGPPAVDIIVTSIHADTAGCVRRTAQTFPMEFILCHIFRIVEKRNLQLDSCLATKYSIRLTLAHELTPGEFLTIAREIGCVSDTAQEVPSETTA